MQSLMNSLAQFFGVFLKGQTYLNMLYLFLAFPLGLFYFVFLTVGLSAGIPLVIVWVGLLILLAVFAAWYAMIAFERQMAIWLLREEIPPMTRQDLTGKSLWQKFTATLSNPVTWKGLVYLIAKFPLGLVSFVVLVTLISLTLGLVAAPFYYQYAAPNYNITVDGVRYIPLWAVDTLGEALLCSLLGVLIGLASLHAFNGLAWVSAKFARVMLGNFSTAPIQPPSAPVEPVTSDLTDADTPQIAVQDLPEFTAPEALEMPVSGL
jgi:hypothetical protein